MKDGWQTEKLGDVCAFLNRGVSPKYLEQGGICVLNQKCIRDHRVNYEQSRRHDTGAKPVSEERIIKLGDVLVNSTGTGTLGRVAQVREMPPEPTTVDSHVTIVRPKLGKFYPDLFGYMLVLIEEAIKDAGEGCGGQTELARSILAEKFTVSYPASHLEQQRIVAILDETFEGIATATANAKKNLNNACELFESTLQSVFATKSKGWQEKNLGEVCLIKPPKNEARKNLKGSDLVSFVPMESLGIGQKYFDVSRLRALEEVAGSYTYFADDDVLLAKITPCFENGKLGIARNLKNGVGFGSSEYIVFRSSAALHNEFLYYFLSRKAFREEGAKRMTGAVGHKRVAKEFIENTFIPLPSFPEQQRITDKLDELSAETKMLEAIYQQKLALLAELKKSLLQQAFSGEL